MPDPIENLGDELTGIWTVVSAWSNGKPVNGRAEFAFAGGFVHVTPLGRGTFPLRYELFPEMMPKGINLGPRGAAGRSKLARGIYEVDVCKLRICLPSSPHTAPFKDRPSDFDLATGRDLWVFTRKVEGSPDSEQPRSAPEPNGTGMFRRLGGAP